MASNPARVYWDSCTYIDYMRGGHARQAEMEMVIEDWKAGRVTMVTSALTIAEVVFVRCEPDGNRLYLDAPAETKMRELFQPPLRQPFVIVELTRDRALAARALVWGNQNAIKPKDAVHVVSAIDARCDVLQTNDGDMVDLSGQLGGSPPLRIEFPTWTRQLEVADEVSVESGAETTFTTLTDANES